jgi:hypothetical protein
VERWRGGRVGQLDIWGLEGRQALEGWVGRLRGLS